MNCTELIRVYFPGVDTTQVIEKLGSATYDNITIQDLIDEGLLYTDTDFKGTEIVCMVTVYGKTTLTMIVSPGTIVNPQPMPIVELVGGRPTRPIAK